MGIDPWHHRRDADQRPHTRSLKSMRETLRSISQDARRIGRVGVREPECGRAIWRLAIERGCGIG
jgi:hypothetical protein